MDMEMDMDMDGEGLPSGTSGTGNGNVLHENAVLVQHDWFNCIRDADGGQFFVGIRQFGVASNFMDVRWKDGRLEPTTNPQAVQLEKLDGRRLSVKFGDLASATFMAPRIEFATLHSSSVQSVDVSCTGRLAVSSDTNGQLIVWHADTAEIIRSFSGHALDVNRCRFFPSGLVVLSAGMDMTLRIWSVETGQCPRVLKGHRQAVVDLGIVDRGKEVLSCSKDGTAKLWCCGTAECLRTWMPEAGPVNALATDSTDSSIFGVACEMGKTKVYDIRNNDTTATMTIAGGEEGTAVTFGAGDQSSSGRYLFMGTAKGTVISYDMKAGKIFSTLRTSRGVVTRLSMVPEGGGLCASFQDGTVCCYGAPISAPNSRLEFSGADCDPIYDISTTANGQLFTACRDRIIRKYLITSN